MESMRNSKNRVLAMVVLCFAFFCGGVGRADLITVGPGPGGPGGGYDYATIQEGINAAVNGDEVVVTEGTYTGTENKNLDFGGRAITVRSTDPEDSAVVDATVIDCESSGRGFYFHCGEEANSVVAGLTVKNGRINGTEEHPDAFGGGIYCSSASPAISNCSVMNNLAYGWDGGLVLGRAYGGGIACVSGSHPTIINCKIVNNRARGSDAFWGGGSGYGGGVYCSSDSTVTICNSIITSNTAQGGISTSDTATTGAHDSYGGGMYISGSSSSSIKNCLITNNQTIIAVGYYPWLNEGQGGPVYGESRGAGIYCGGNITVNNCTISGNNTDPDNVLGGGGSGGGIYGPATVSDCIIRGNISGSQLSGATSVSYSDVEGVWSGTGNINADPLFVTGPLGDYYLSQTGAGQASTSPCVDAGSNAAAFLGMGYSTTRTDHVSETGVVDMGYHYLNFGHNNPDINADRFVNYIDYSVLASQWLDEPSVPSADIAPYVGDGIVDTNDLELLVDFWLECYVSVAGSPSPGDNESGVELDVLLSWSAGGGAAYHDVYFGTNANLVADANKQSAEFMGTVSDVNFSLFCLEFDTYYYWRIDEAGLGNCTTKGDVWGFRTTEGLEFMAFNPEPASGAMDVDPNTVLSWSAGMGSLSHDVYFGSSWVSVEGATVASDEYMGNFDVNSYDPCGLDSGTVYFWRIDEETEFGTVKGDVWGFKTIGMSDFKAINPEPADGALGVDPNIILIWTTMYEVLSHDVYLGTDFNDVNDANVYSDAYMGNFDVPSYDPCGLELGTVYFWRIDEENVLGTAKGDVWNFRTIDVNFSLVGWWEFEEGSDITAYDSSGYVNDGMLVGPPDWAAGKIGDYALDFDGDGDFVEMGDTVKNYLGTSYTVSAWIKADAIGTGRVIAAYRHSSNGTPILFQLAHYYGGEVRFFVRDDYGNIGYAIYSNAITADIWYHVAGVREGNTFTLNVYVNGVSGTSTSQTFGTIINPDNLKVGASQSGGNPPGNFFDGTIDDVRIYDRALSAGEIWQLYQGGLTP